MRKFLMIGLQTLALIIISFPAFASIINPFYFSMHDDQQIARLYLLVRAVGEGNIFPRWVNGLGFGFGYPLFNFYPPLIYYMGLIFHTIGFSFIWSTKLMFIASILTGSVGAYLLARNFFSRKIAYVVVTLYTYFFYRAVVMYVRGALAEFFAGSVLLFLFDALIRMYRKPSLGAMVYVATAFGVLILAHPLIAFPSVIYIIFFGLFLLAKAKDRFKFMWKGLWGGVLGLGLSAFFWLPSLVERKYTLVDAILTHELASYQIHFVCPYQFWFSPWGFGGSEAGCIDGMTFQLGHIHIFILIMAIALLAWSIIRHRLKQRTHMMLFILFLLLFTLFMATDYSAFIWSRISFLWYLQFPWRFLAFAAVFIALLGGYAIDALSNFISRFRVLPWLLVIGVCLIVIVKYLPYFHPQRYLDVTDAQRTSFDEIAWRISSTSFEFVPKQVAVTKSSQNTTILNIQKNNLPDHPMTVISGSGIIQSIRNTNELQEYSVRSDKGFVGQINTYYFPGWHVYLDGKETPINTQNTYYLMRITIPPGNHTVQAIFRNTQIRTIGDSISILSLFILCGLCMYCVYVPQKNSTENERKFL